MSETGEPGAGEPSTVHSSLRACAACGAGDGTGRITAPIGSFDGTVAGGRSACRAGASLPGMMRKDTRRPPLDRIAFCRTVFWRTASLRLAFCRTVVDRVAPGRAALELTRTPRMDVDAVVAEVAAAVGLAEGPAGVADVLRVIARHEPVAAREVSRRAELPVPIVVAGCNELRQRGVVDRARPVQLTAAGRLSLTGQETPGAG